MSIPGDKIREFQLINKITKRKLALKAEISNTYLSDREKGRTNSSLRTLLKLALALGVDDKELF